MSYTSGTSHTGMQGSTTYGSGGNNLLVDSFSSSLIQLNPNGSAPLFTLTDSIKAAKTAMQPSHSFWTEKLVFPLMVLSAAAGADAAGTVSTEAVVSSANVIPGMVFKINSTSEQVLVTAVNSATSIDIRRGFGSTVPAASTASDTLLHVGNAFEEASVRPSSMAMNQTETINNTQIFRNTWAVPGSVAASTMKVGGGKVAKNRTDAAWFHAMDIEKALWFSEKYTGVLNNMPVRAMRGLLPAIIEGAPTNVNAAGATTTYDQLEAMIDPSFDVVTDPSFSQERIAFCGGQARKVINQIGRSTGQFQLVEGATSFGMTFERFKLSRGEILLVEHPLFNTNDIYKGMLCSLDLSSLDLAYLEGRKTFHKGYNTGVNSEGAAADNGVDAEGGTLTTELTLECTNPEANVVITGLTAAA